MGWSWASASCRGTSHVRNGTRCQDFSRTLRVGRDRSILVLLASDGAGSASFGGEGAAIVCRAIGEGARAYFADSAALPDQETVLSWLDSTRDLIGVAADARAALPRDFAATLVGAIVADDQALLIHIGDGAAVVRQGDGWRIGSWPDQGEFASTTYFVTDEPGPRLRLNMVGAIDAVALFTDGIERLVLNFATREVHGSFFETMIAPVARSDADGRNARLCAALGAYLDGDAVNGRTDDDKTLILAARR